MQTTLRETLAEHIPTEPEYINQFDRFEYFLALVAADLRPSDALWFWSPIGCFGWRSRGTGAPEELSAEAEAAGADWTPLQAGFFSGSFDRFSEVKRTVDQLRAELSWW